MNLFKLHSNPETLDHFDEQYKMPGKAWPIYINALKDKDTETKKWIWPWFIKDPESSYSYAVWKGERFPEGEEAIKWHPMWARKYAMNVLERRWPEAEEIIASDKIESNIYAVQFGLDDWMYDSN